MYFAPRSLRLSFTIEAVTFACPYCTTSNDATAGTCRVCGASLSHGTAIQSSPHLPIGTRLHRQHAEYVIEGVLGQGGFGITYRARGLQGVVAIKELFPEDMVTRAANHHVQANPGSEHDFEQLRVRFEVEADTLRRIHHPSATQIFECWFEHGTAFMAMEFIQGQTLEQRLQRGPLTEKQALMLLGPMLEVLHEVHGKGLLHRDIKPGNIILNNNQPELIDFGSVARFTPGKTMRVSQRLLTPAYAPLEQYGTSVKLGPQTDLYALGATMYEALTGIKPPSSLERANGTKLRPIQSVNPTIRADVVNVIEQMLEMQMANRIVTAKRALEMIEVAQVAYGLNGPIKQKTPTADSDLFLFFRTQNPSKAEIAWFITWSVVPWILSVVAFVAVMGSKYQNPIGRVVLEPKILDDLISFGLFPAGVIAILGMGAAIATFFVIGFAEAFGLGKASSRSNILSTLTWIQLGFLFGQDNFLWGVVAFCIGQTLFWVIAETTN